MKQLALTALLACTVQAAEIYTFAGGHPATQTGAGTLGNSFTFENVNDDGVIVTVSAFSLLGGGFTFSDAWIGRYLPGMGVCNAFEGVFCGENGHQLDNEESYDFLLFQFNVPVLINQVRIDPTSFADRDVLYMLGDATTTDLSGITVGSLASLGFEAPVVDASTPSLIARTVNIANGGVAYTSLLIGAPDINNDPDSFWSSFANEFLNFDPDFFKVQLISYDAGPPPVTDVPEPASIALAGAGLVAIGVLSRRRLRGK